MGWFGQIGVGPEARYARGPAIHSGAPTTARPPAKHRWTQGYLRAGKAFADTGQAQVKCSSETGDGAWSVKGLTAR